MRVPCEIEEETNFEARRVFVEEKRSEEQNLSFGQPGAHQ